MSSPIAIRPHWHGFGTIKHIVVFGDSYSSVGYDSRAPHPTPEDPLGVEFPGITFTRTSEEPNWVGHLITEYCPRPSVLVYDYAVGGDTIHGVKHQIDYHFMRSLASKPDWAPWTADDTLFVTWVGINDCGRFVKDFSQHMQLLSELQQELYTAGARNFLFIDVPPIQRSPIGLIGSSSLTSRLRKWNESLNETVAKFARDHVDATTMVFSSWDSFTRILDDPVAHGFLETDVGQAIGGIWADHLHPTSRVHDFVARDISEFLQSQPPQSEPSAEPVSAV